MEETYSHSEGIPKDVEEAYSTVIMKVFLRAKD